MLRSTRPGALWLVCALAALAMPGCLAAQEVKTGGAAVAEPAAEAGKPVVECEVLTVLELLPEGLHRLDAILYDVRSGSLEQFVLEPPPGLEEEIMEAYTDEISGMAVAADQRLAMPRKLPLQGAGHLLLVSTPAPLPAGGISLDPVKPEAEVRARYLALSSLLPADVRLLPEASGTRVSVSDLPAAFSEALTFIDRTVVWRLPADGEGARLAVAPLPYVPAREIVIQRRDTIVLMDSHGTLLFFDRFLFRSRIPAVLEMALPAGGKLLAARVNDVPVREPQERAGAVLVQLAWDTSGVVEVVSVQERERLRSDHTDLTLDLPQVTAPVLAHRLRWLVPGNASYRVRRGDLQAVLPSTAAFSKKFDFEVPRSHAHFIGPGYISDGNARLLVKVTDTQGIPEFQKEIDQLMERLHGVETPFLMSIPADGKVLAFTGVLPPARVTVELDVRAEK